MGASAGDVALGLHISMIKQRVQGAGQRRQI